MNRTVHYGLPLFEATDKPSILVDWNETMAELDNALFTIATGGDTSVVDAINALQQAVASINSQITVINQTLGDTLDTTFMNNIAPQFEATGATYNPRDMVFHNGNLYICFTQYTGIQDDEEHFDQYFIPVWLAQKVTDNLNDVDSLKTRMTTAESGLSGLDTRVTTLENAPTSTPSLSDIDIIDENDLLSISLDPLNTIITNASGTSYTKDGVVYTNNNKDLVIGFKKDAFLQQTPNAKKVVVFVSFRYMPQQVIELSGSSYVVKAPFVNNSAYLFDQILDSPIYGNMQDLDFKRCILQTPAANALRTEAFIFGAGFQQNYVNKRITINLDSVPQSLESAQLLRYMVSISKNAISSVSSFITNVNYADKLDVGTMTGHSLVASVKYKVIE